jgi:hypothetical protein
MDNSNREQIQQSQFVGKVEKIINELNMENAVGMPDFIIAGYLWDCYTALTGATFESRTWHKAKPNRPQPIGDKAVGR